MRIAGIGSSFPDRVVSNEEVLEIIERNSSKTFEGDLKKTLRKINFLFRRSGIEQRYWLSKDDTSFNHIEKSVNAAIKQAEICKDDIDLLIYTSVDRQIREPGHSFFIANELKIHKTQCFDIVEACAGWSRATQIAQVFLDQDVYKTIMIITSEFNCHEGAWAHQGFALEQEHDLNWGFSLFTLGEGATATILKKDETMPWKFDFIGKAEYSNLCMAPISDAIPLTVSKYGESSLRGKGRSKFVSYAMEMEKYGIPWVKKLVERNMEFFENADIVIPHSQTKKTYLDIANFYGKEWPYFFTYPQYGNLVSGSVPSGIDIAQKKGILKRGQKVTATMTAAGFSFVFYFFEF